jgi:hypothetical protein
MVDGAARDGGCGYDGHGGVHARAPDLRRTVDGDRVTRDPAISRDDGRRGGFIAILTPAEGHRIGWLLVSRFLDQIG